MGLEAMRGEQVDPGENPLSAETPADRGAQEELRENADKEESFPWQTRFGRNYVKFSGPN